MTIVDLDDVQHEAELRDDKIHSGGWSWTADEFVLAGLMLAQYDEAEEAELLKIGLRRRLIKPLLL